MELFIYFLALTFWTLINRRVLGTHNPDISLVIAQMYISLKRRKNNCTKKKAVWWIGRSFVVCSGDEQQWMAHGAHSQTRHMIIERHFCASVLIFCTCVLLPCIIPTRTPHAVALHVRICTWKLSPYNTPTTICWAGIFLSLLSVTPYLSLSRSNHIGDVCVLCVDCQANSFLMYKIVSRINAYCDSIEK